MKVVSLAKATVVIFSLNGLVACNSRNEDSSDRPAPKVDKSTEKPEDGRKQKPSSDGTDSKTARPSIAEVKFSAVASFGEGDLRESSDFSVTQGALEDGFGPDEFLVVQDSVALDRGAFSLKITADRDFEQNNNLESFFPALGCRDSGPFSGVTFQALKSVSPNGLEYSYNFASSVVSELREAARTEFPNCEKLYIGYTVYDPSPGFQSPFDMVFLIPITI